ncbi:hypothetical protein K7711_30650 [Nocardia sp. CA2R105]|uniref:hypothetical protein n=1 Tax=Nocardia coffeae TaxID=2873381 RepID=UPI001CA5F9F2|nr:hypothetical protein [Nocardia coffeae]MBY8860870.1 hypothetical protein [Nocardia coffeae]
MGTRVDYGSSWARSSLRELDSLRRARAVDTDALQVIAFAIRWAPFGGAGTGELLVVFGVGRRRFVEMLDAGLEPHRTDGPETRLRKRALLKALRSAWRFDEAPPTTPVQ